MEKLLLGLEGVSCFMDDIVVTGRNREEHLEMDIKRFLFSNIQLLF